MVEEGSGSSASRWTAELHKILDAITKEMEVPDNTQGDGLDRTMTIIDAKLLPFLRTDHAPLPVRHIVALYTPKVGQTWDSIAQPEGRNTNVENTILDPDEDPDYLGTVLCSIHRLMAEIKTRYIDVNKSKSSADEEKALKQSFDITIFFATDRKYIEENDEYSSSYAGVIQYGSKIVSIPESHNIGCLESPVCSEEAEFSQHIGFCGGGRHSKEEFLENVYQEVKQIGHENGSGPGSGELLILIHGCNTTLSKAAKRAAQLKYDMNFQGVLILYSWSTKDNILGYFVDEKNVVNTQTILTKFLSWIISSKKGICDTEQDWHLLVQSCK